MSISGGNRGVFIIETEKSLKLIMLSAKKTLNRVSLWAVPQLSQVIKGGSSLVSKRGLFVAAKALLVSVSHL